MNKSVFSQRPLTFSVLINSVTASLAHDMLHPSIRHTKPDKNIPPSSFLIPVSQVEKVESRIYRPKHVIEQLVLVLSPQCRRQGI
jgi:hypothetical protein